MRSAYRLPDLRLMHRLEARVRAASDAELVEFLDTADAHWLYVECHLWLAADILARLEANAPGTLAEEADIFDLLAIRQAERTLNNGGAA